MALTVTQICRYPVKGLSAEPLPRVELSAGKAIAQDRRFAIAHGTTRFDPSAPEWLPKARFLQLMTNERLARLRTRFEESTGILTIERDGKTVAHADVTSAAGRNVIEAFFAAFMSAEMRGAPRLVEAPGHTFADSPSRLLSLINLASVRDLERVARARVDRLRFRGNLYFDGGDAWDEMRWRTRRLRIGTALLRVTEPIERCAATNVNPETAARDLNLPLTLQEGFRHSDLGVYAEVIAGGTISVGDAISLLD